MERHTADRSQFAYGSRAKLGLIVPVTNTVNEAEWCRMMPSGVTFHTARTALHTHDVSTEALARDIAAKAADLMPAGIDVLAYACTAGSMVTPAQSLPDAIAALIGVPAVTTAAAIVKALHYIGATRISVATPYHDALNAHEVAFLAAAGIEVLAIQGLGIGAGGPAEYPYIAKTPLAAVRDHARQVFQRGSDALLITCTDFPTLSLIGELEAELAVPVITSNQATLWDALRTIGVTESIPGAGRLLAAPTEADLSVSCKESSSYG